MTSGSTLIKISLLIVVLASVACSKKGTSSASAMAPVNVSSGNNNTTLPIQIAGPADDSDPDVIVTLPPASETVVTTADLGGASTAPAPSPTPATSPTDLPAPSPAEETETSPASSPTTEPDLDSVIVINIINPIVIVTASEDAHHLFVDCGNDESLLFSTVAGTDVVALICQNGKAHVPVAKGCYLVKDHKPGRPAKICMKNQSIE